MRTPLLSGGITRTCGWALLLVLATVSPGIGDVSGVVVMRAARAETPEAKTSADDSDVPGTAQLVAQIQTDINRKLTAVAQIWCHETIYRYSQTGNAARPVHKIEADVELLDGIETYTSVHKGSKTYRSFRDIRGVWSSGELATILNMTREVVLAEPGAVTGVDAQDGDDIAVVSFRHIVPRAAWVIELGSNSYPISFDGRIWVSRRSREIKRIEWRGINLPAKMGISAVEWSVNFGPATLAGQPDIRPIRSTFTVMYQGVKTRVDRNVILFSDFRGYRSDSAIRFEPEGGFGGGDSAPTAASGLLNQRSRHKTAPPRRSF